MSSWNHRVLAHKHNDEVYFKIHEVHYDDNKNPVSYSATPMPVSGGDIKTIRWVLQKMKECLNEPILWAGESFPKVCTVKYTCLNCGRNKFIKPLPHNCKSGFTKRGLNWEMYHE